MSFVVRPGTYYIVNRDVDDLAVQVDSTGSPLIVSKRQDIPAQLWDITSVDGDMVIITSMVASNLYTQPLYEPLGDFVQANEGEYEWYIDDQGIWDRSHTNRWGVNKGDSSVVLRPNPDYPNWTFIEA